MWLTSARFDRTLPYGHTVATRVEVLDGDQVIANLTDLGVVVDGSVTAGRSAVQRSGMLSLVDATGALTPRDIGDLLVPAGNQLRLWRGISFVPGDEELCPLITARFTASTSTYPVIEISEMYDRSWIVAGALLESVLSIALGTLVVDAITALLTAAMPDVVTNFPDSDETTNAMAFDPGEDPWKIAQDLAANIGMRLFFDPMGVATMMSEPDITDPPAFTLDDTAVDGMALPGTALEWSGTGYNAVLVIAENSDLAAPLRALVKDLDPQSPTQWGGRFGRRLAPVIRDEKLASQVQVQARGEAELSGQLGFIQTVTAPTLVNPALEVGDVVRVNITRADQVDSPPIASQLCVLDAFTVPMRAGGGQSLTMLARRVVVTE